MRFERSRRPIAFRAAFFGAAFVVTVAFSPGCGVLGEKPGLDRVLKFAGASTGCLNDFGPNVKRYLEGTIAPSEWEQTWDCAIDAIDLFREFVKPGTEDGYSREDIRDLVSNLLVTHTSVSDALIESTFLLKASIFGGTDRHVSTADLDLLIRLLQIGKTESTELLPHLANRARTPTPELLREFAAALEKAASTIAGALPVSGNAPFTLGAANVLLSELSRLHGLEIPEYSAAAVMAVKGILTGGPQDRLERWEWAELFRLAGALGGRVTAGLSVDRELLNGPNEYGDYLVSLILSAKPVLQASIELHGGAIPAARLDRLVDTLPAELLPVSTDTIKKSLRPLVARVLRPEPVVEDEAGTSLDSVVIDTVFAYLDRWNRGQTHLETLFDSYGLDPLGVGRQRLLQAFDSYVISLDPPERPHAERLESLAAYFRPLFAGVDQQITFAPSVRHSLHHLSLVHVMNLVAERLLGAYSSVEGREFAVALDLKELIDDFIDVGFELGVMEKDVPEVHERRFGEADVFTFGSNGDGLLSAGEATYYFLYLYSASSLSRKRIIGDIGSQCAGDELDPLGVAWMDARCFRSRFFSDLGSYLDFFPQLFNAYDRLNVGRKKRFNEALETAARRYGLTDRPVGSFDTDGFAGILHYVETVFSRFDANNDQIIDLRESFEAFPLFKRLLAKVGGAKEDQEFLLKAAFTYTLKYARPPDTKSAKGMVHFLSWVAWRPFWRISASRYTLTRIFAALVEPESPPEVDDPVSGP